MAAQDIIQEQRKRQTAFRFRISDLVSGTVISSNNLNFLEIGNKRITRVNIVANVIDKFINEGEKKYAALTIDDASGQIRIKAFGEDIQILEGIEIGNTISVIGNVRFFNNETYILPEIIRQVDPKWLVVRKIELEKNTSDKSKTEQPITYGKEDKSNQQEVKDKTNSLKKEVINMLKRNEDGIDVDKIIMEMDSPVEEINSIITKMLEEAEIYEPKPGRIRLL